MWFKFRTSSRLTPALHIFPLLSYCMLDNQLLTLVSISHLFFTDRTWFTCIFNPYSWTSSCNFFWGKPNLRAECGGCKRKTLHDPLKAPSTQAAKLYARKAEAINQWTLNEAMLPMRKKGKMRKEIWLFCTPSTGSTNTHSHLYHREGMGKWEKKGPTPEVRNKIRKTGKIWINYIMLS